MNGATAQQKVSFRAVLAVGEFRALFAAQSLSVVGDQLARIAIASLLFDRTHSVLITAASYALSYLPWIVGGPTLSVLADRHSRRKVMILCDLSRAVLIAVTAMPNLPTAVVLSIVCAAALFQPPFTSARAALIPDVVGEGSAYTAASTLGNSTNQLGVVLGFALGGMLTASLGAHATVLVDALTFAISAGVVSRQVAARPSANALHTAWSTEIRAGARAVFSDGYLRWLVTTSWIVVGTVIATEAIAVPYARSHGHGAVAAGVLTASAPAGTVTGALILGRMVQSSVAERLMRPLAFATAIALAMTALDAGVVLTSALWFVVGAASSMSVIANRVFVVSVPAKVRGRAFGIAAAGVSGAQGFGTVATGAIARHASPANAVGAVAIVAITLLVIHEVALRRSAASKSRHELA